MKPDPHRAAREAPSSFPMRTVSPPLDPRGTTATSVASRQETRNLEIELLVLESSPTCCVTLGRLLHFPEPHFPELLHCDSFLATLQVYQPLS